MSKKANFKQAEMVDLLRQRIWLEPWNPLPKDVREYPTMLTLEELRMLRWLTAHYYSGQGLICDLGAFLGGSTMALSSGLSENKNTGVIHSYDRYLCDAGLWNKYGMQKHLPHPENDDFHPLMPKLMGALHKNVEFNQGDFCSIAPPEGKIEILFVDIAKTVQTHDHVMLNYMSKLIPGHSIVIQQDYQHIWPFWDVAAMEILSDYFEVVSATHQHCAIFLNTKAIPKKALEDCLVKNLSVERLTTLLKSAADRWNMTPQKYAIYEMWELLNRTPDLELEKRGEQESKIRFQKIKLDREDFWRFSRS